MALAREVHALEDSCVRGGGCRLRGARAGIWACQVYVVDDVAQLVILPHVGVACERGCARVRVCVRVSMLYVVVCVCVCVCVLACVCVCVCVVVLPDTGVVCVYH